MRKGTFELSGHENVKLGALLKFMGVVTTGGEGKEVIQAGYVKINGETCTQRGKKVVEGDVVTIEDVEITVTK